MGAARIQCTMLCYAPTRCRPGYLRYAAVRDVNLTALRYVAEAVRIRLFALRYTTARRGFGCVAYCFVAVRRSLNLITRRS